MSGEEMQIKHFEKEMTDICFEDKGQCVIPICVDFDGTIVKHWYPKIGNGVPHAIEVMKELTEKYNVGWILDTMRSDDKLQEAVDYVTSQGIELYGISTNPTQKTWTNSPKAYGIFSVDDRNIGVPLIYEKDEVPYVDWLKIKEIITPILDAMVKAN